jgi:hypothetical protein
MQSLEMYLKNITEPLDLSESMKRRIKEESIDHLEEEIQHCLANGMSREDAEKAAIEKFGKSEVMAKLVGDALSNRQRRFRLQRSLQILGIAAILVVLSIIVGFWFNMFDDAVSGEDFVHTMPRYVWTILYVGCMIGGITILSALTCKLFHVRTILVIFSALAVLATFFAAVFIFDNIPLLKEEVGFTHGNETPYVLAFKAFCMRIYLCWIPTIIVGIAILLLACKRKYVLLLCVSLCIGFLSAAFFGISRLGNLPIWLYFMKWPKFLSVGLLAMLFMMLTGILSISIMDRSKSAG